MKLNLPFARIILLVFVSLAITACSSREKGDSRKKISDKLFEHEFQRRLDNINPGLQDPAMVITLIEMCGAEFLDDLVNTHEHDSLYLLDSALSALNLGVYTVDIAYLVTYYKDEEALDQLAKARALANGIGAGYLFDHGMFQRYRTLGIPQDSLLMVLRKAAEQLEHDFTLMELKRIRTLFVTGEFIEKLHLTTRLFIQADKENADNYLNLMLLLLFQEKSLGQLINLLDQIRRSEEGERFMAMMNDLRLIFMELNRSDELADINTSNITENQIFQDLVAQIALIRNQIIDPGTI